MLVVGLTGGIGTGKTTVANLFANHGVPIIDADQIAREVTQSDSPAFLDIMDHFNEPLLQEDGTLDRAKLRQIIFERPDERQWLENLLHPLILKAIQQQIKKLSALYCLVVIPLLLETGPYPFIDRILVVDTTEQTQLDRTRERDKASADLIATMIKSQVSRTDRQAKAHDLINNDGILDHLTPQIDKLHALYLSLAKNNRS